MQFFDQLLVDGMDVDGLLKDLTGRLPEFFRVACETWVAEGYDDLPPNPFPEEDPAQPRAEVEPAQDGAGAEEQLPLPLVQDVRHDLEPEVFPVNPLVPNLEAHPEPEEDVVPPLPLPEDLPAEIPDVALQHPDDLMADPEAIEVVPLPEDLPAENPDVAGQHPDYLMGDPGAIEVVDNVLPSPLMEVGTGVLVAGAVAAGAYMLYRKLF